MVDLLGIENAERVNEIYSLGARLFCLHIGKDLQRDGELATLSLFKLVEGLEDIHIAVVDGVNFETASGFLKAGVDIFIVGSFISGSENPSERAKQLENVEVGGY